MDQSSKNVIEAARSRNEKSEDDGLILLSSGVKLKPVQVPNMIYVEVLAKFQQPKVPRSMNEDLGREEENPSHPDYIAAMQEWQTNVTKAIVNMMILFGTELVFTPKGVAHLSDTSWSKKLKLSGIEFDDSDEYSRYLMWVKTVAAPSDTDVERIMTGVGRLSGVLEQDVDNAVSQFRN